MVNGEANKDPSCMRQDESSSSNEMKMTSWHCQLLPAVNGCYGDSPNICQNEPNRKQESGLLIRRELQPLKLDTTSPKRVPLPDTQLCHPDLIR